MSKYSTSFHSFITILIVILLELPTNPKKHVAGTLILCYYKYISYLLSILIILLSVFSIGIVLPPSAQVVMCPGGESNNYHNERKSISLSYPR